MADEPVMTKEEALEAFKQLVDKHGAHWTMATPEHVWNTYERIKKVTTLRERRAALGLEN